MQTQALKRRRAPAMLGAALCLLAAQARAEVLEGRVVGVTDGDTLKVLTASNTQERVRLAGIDAPERAQPYGAASKQGLSDLVYDRHVAVHWHKRDRYGRIVGVVWITDIDAGLEQVRSGLAWHYKKYAAEQSPEERARYTAAETAAREARTGLWVDAEPISPWDWRHR